MRRETGNFGGAPSSNSVRFLECPQTPAHRNSAKTIRSSRTGQSTACRMARLGQRRVRGKLPFHVTIRRWRGEEPRRTARGGHAACFSMALSLILGGAGFAPDRIKTSAVVEIRKSEGGFAIPTIKVVTRRRAPRLDEATFVGHAKPPSANVRSRRRWLNAQPRSSRTHDLPETTADRGAASPGRRWRAGITRAGPSEGAGGLQTPRTRRRPAT